MNNLTSFEFESNEVRFVDGKPVAIDVARVLGYKSPKDAIRNLINKDYLTSVVLPTIRYGETKPRNQKLLIISKEAGIYQLIFKSKLPNAEQFQDWVFEEVLPSIRKTGSYNLPEKKRAISYYTDRIMLLPSSLEQNPDYWTVIEESGHLLLDVERLGYPVEQFDLLDGSVGKRWSNYRKLNNLGSKTITLLYKFDDCRGKVKVNGYPYSELGEFKFWLKNVYTPKLLPKYLESKYTGIVLSN